MAKKLSEKALKALVALAFFPYNSCALAQNLEKIEIEGIVVTAPSLTAIGDIPPSPFSGGQIAAGGRVGILGERESLDIPFNVYSFTNEFINDAQAYTLGDVLRNDASIVVGQSSGGYSEAYKFRGFNLSGADISYGGLYGVLPSKTVNASLLGRVELLKGASAFANGVSAGGGGVGGSVNVEPKHADDIALTRLSTGYASNKHGSLGFDIGRRFGDNNEFGIRITGNRESGEQGIVNDNNRNTSGIMGLDYRSQDFNLSLDVGYEKDHLSGGNMPLAFIEPGAPGWGKKFNGNKLPSPPKANKNYSPDWGVDKNETKFFLLRGDYTLSENWIGYAAIGGNESTSFSREASVDVYDKLGSANTGFMDTNTKSDSFASQIGVRGYFQSDLIHHQVNIGYSGIYSRTKQFMSSDGGSTEYNIYSDHPPKWNEISSNSNVIDILKSVAPPGLKQRIYNNGISLSDELGLLDNALTITLGGRYQVLENYGYNAPTLDLSHDESLPAGAKLNHYKEHTISPIYGIAYKVTPYISIYANHVEALQPADVATASIKNYPSLTNPGQSPGVIKSKQNEIGINYRYNNIGGNINIFEIKQPRASINQSGTRYDLYGEQRNRGLELSIYGSPYDSLRIFSSASWTDAAIIKSEDGLNKGNTPPGIPKHQVVAGSEWDLPFNRNITLTGKLTHTGSQYVAETNKLKLDPWSRFDLGLRYKIKTKKTLVTWRATIENVTNKSYWASASMDDNARLSVGEPRTFKLSMDIDF